MLPMPPSPVNLFNLSTPPSEMYLPFLKAPLIAYQESETTEQRIAWLFRAIHDINSILACHEEACKEIKERLDTVEAELVKLDEDLKIERAERIQADQDLSDRIDAEEAARIAADQQLQANIDSETAARQAADQQLQSNIDSEIANRKAADTTLRNRIAAEEQARAEADQATAARLDTLEACCEDAATKSELATERNARANFDTALDQRVSTLETKCANGECGGGGAGQTIDSFIGEIVAKSYYVPLVSDNITVTESGDFQFDMPTVNVPVPELPPNITAQQVSDELGKYGVEVKFCVSRVPAIGKDETAMRFPIFSIMAEAASMGGNYVLLDRDVYPMDYSTTTYISLQGSWYVDLDQVEAGQFYKIDTDTVYMTISNKNYAEYDMPFTGKAFVFYSFVRNTEY